MKFTVVWVPSAADRLADLWIEAEDREAIASATNQIDKLLKSDPSQQGESRLGSRRILIVPPLIVAIEIHEPDRVVKVLGVRLQSRKR